MSTDDLSIGYGELVCARPAYEKAENFYCGTVDEIHSSHRVAKMLSKFGLSNLDSFNFAHIPVDVVVDKLKINQVTTEDNTVDVLIDDIRDANDLDEEFGSLLKDACKYGDAYLFVWPDTDAEGNVTGVKMRVKDPLSTRVVYSVEDPMVKEYAIQSWVVGSGKNKMVRANLYYADRVERYIYMGRKPTKSSKWEEYTGDGIPAVRPNPFGEVPFFHFRTDRTYGQPLHLNAYGPQQSINKLITSHMATVDFQSFPQRYALLDPMADPSGSQSNDLDEDHPEDGEDPETAGESQLNASPMAVWQLAGMKEVGQFQAADPDAFLKPLTAYILAMSQVTQVPQTAFENVRDTSGESRRVADEPLNQRIERLQKLFGSTARRAYEFALKILGEEVNVTVKWAPIRKVEDLEGWQVIEAKVLMGVPRDVVLAEAGYDSADVDVWLKDFPKELPSVQETPVKEPQNADTQGE